MYHWLCEVKGRDPICIDQGLITNQIWTGAFQMHIGPSAQVVWLVGQEILNGDVGKVSEEYK